MVKDLTRLCDTLLQNREGTHIHSALMAMYVSARTPKAIDESAMLRLNRKWAVQMPKDLELCGWAGGSKAKYLKFLNFDTHIHLHDHWVGEELFAWGSVCIEITRKPLSQRKKSI